METAKPSTALFDINVHLSIIQISKMTLELGFMNIAPPFPLFATFDSNKQLSMNELCFVEIDAAPPLVSDEHPLKLLLRKLKSFLPLIISLNNAPSSLVE